MSTDIPSCDRCVFCGEQYYEGEEDFYDSAYECRWPAPKRLPPSLSVANRERESVSPKDALWCQWYEPKPQPQG